MQAAEMGLPILGDEVEGATVHCALRSDNSCTTQYSRSKKPCADSKKCDHSYTYTQERFNVFGLGCAYFLGAWAIQQVT